MPKWLYNRQIDRKNVHGSMVRAILFPLCALFFAAILFLQGQSHFKSSYSALLSLQLPFLYAVKPPDKELLPPPNISLSLVRTDIDSDVSNKVILELQSVKENTFSDITSQDKPSVLIYHTHATEAYFPTEGYEYIESDRWRSEDNTRNIVSVGEKLQTLLKDKYGIYALHDTTNHEPPKLSTSYSRSVVTMEKYKELYPSIKIFIDVHRDAYGDNPQNIKDFIEIDGVESARLMFVVGTGEGATGTGFGETPDFASNYAFAKAITDYLAEIDEGLIRNIRIKTGRYNQHISNKCLLVEVGHNANSLEQALNAVDFLAKAIASIISNEKSNVMQSESAPTPLPLIP